MKTSKKICIAVCALVLVIAAGIASVYVVKLHNVPQLEKEMLRKNPISYNSVYVVGQPPYSKSCVFDTPVGLKNYWVDNHSGGNGMEIVLQQTKDGELIMLSEELPALSNADDLFGKDVEVSALTLEEMRKINLAYDFVDEDGFNTYAGIKDEQLTNVSVVTLEDMLTFFEAPNKTTARLFIRFFDESKIDNLESALQTIYDAVQAHSLLEEVIFCPQSEASAAAVDKACPEFARAATKAEAKSLFRSCMSGETPDALPFSAIFEKANAQFGSEKFIHYARNLGLAVILSGVSEDDAVTLRNYGVTALATSDPETFIQILKDARKADRESNTAAD